MQMSAGGGERLRGLLERERECCARLAPILDAERTAAATYDHAALLACLQERETVQAEWQRVAAERRRLLQSLEGTLNEVATGDPELTALVRALQADADGVRSAQRINEGLIRTALAQVTDLLSVIKRELPETQYDGRASLTTPTLLARGEWRA